MRTRFNLILFLIGLFVVWLSNIDPFPELILLFMGVIFVYFLGYPRRQIREGGGMIDPRLDQFLQKGPVDIPSVQYKIWSPAIIEYVRNIITDEEWFQLGIAHGHAVDVGEGRGEWDDIAGRIRERLG